MLERQSGGQRSEPGPSTTERLAACWDRRLGRDLANDLGRVRATDLATALTGYSPAEWSSELSASDNWNHFADFVKGSVPVCHNPSFDRAFITLEAADHDITDLGTDYHWIGTESLAWPIYRAGALAGISLDELAAHLGYPPEPVPHVALNGARACRRVYLGLMSGYMFSSGSEAQQAVPE